MTIKFTQQQSLIYSHQHLGTKCTFAISGKSLFGHMAGISSYYEIKEGKRETDARIQLLKGQLAKEFVLKLGVLSKTFSVQQARMQQFHIETKRVYKLLESELFRKFVIEFQLKRKGLILSQQARLGKTELDAIEMSI